MSDVLIFEYLSLQILILADESVEDSAIQADSRSLATLLLIRDIQVLIRICLIIIFISPDIYIDPNNFFLQFKIFN